MLINPIKLDFYSNLTGKLATTLKEIVATSEHGDLVIPSQSTILLLKVDLIGKYLLLDRTMTFQQKLEWITFKAYFTYKALFGENIVEFIDKKLAIVPKMD